MLSGGATTEKSDRARGSGSIVRPIYAESLEQLRIREAGERMHTYEVSESPPGVDTPEDLDRVRLALGDNSIDDNKP